MTEPLHLKYRPQNFDEVLGHMPQLRSLHGVLKRKGAQSFLFIGPAGTGKTSLARIVAKEYGVEPSQLVEVDAADQTGVDAMRVIKQMLAYRPFSGQMKAVLIDECHRLSGNAWDSLLKAMEEPPKYALWLLCTTNPTKVPKTIVSRCHTTKLSELTKEELGTLIDDIVEEEQIQLPKGVHGLIVSQARGSARQALVNLEAVRSVKNRQEAAQVLQTVDASDTVLELCRFMAKGGSWTRAMSLLKELGEVEAEGVRIHICNYFAKAALNQKSDGAAMRMLSILDAFSTPYHPGEKLAPLMLSIGQVLFGEEE